MPTSRFPAIALCATVCLIAQRVSLAQETPPATTTVPVQMSPEARRTFEEAIEQANRARQAADGAAQQEQDAANQPPGRGRGTRGGRGGRGGAGFAESGFSGGRSFSQAQTELSPAADAANAPKTPISLQLWVLTVALPAEKAKDAAAASLYEQVAQLPITIGNYSDVMGLISRLRIAGLIEKSREFRHFAINGENSQTQSGANEPSITSSTTLRGSRAGGPLGDRNNSYTYTPVGTQVQLLPLIESNGELRVQLNYTSSEIEKSPDVAISESEDGTHRILANRIVNRTCQANVRLKSGSAVLVQSDSEVQSIGAAVKRTTLVILTASVQNSAQ